VRVDDRELHRRLERVRATFDIERILKQRMDTVYIQRYYRATWFPYWLWNSRRGYVHLGITHDGVFKSSDMESGLRIIADLLGPQAHVLELACGKGANLAYLARRNPALRLTGIDLSPAHLRLARQRLRTDARIIAGDYHDLQTIDTASIDLVFVIEGLCYSKDKTLVLEEVFRVLRPGGRFVIIDGYEGTRDDCSPDELLARDLTMRGMALDSMDTYPALRSSAIDAGFSVEREEDATSLVIPCCERFERLARHLFNRGRLARPICSVLPAAFTYNAITGYFFAELFRRRLAEYWIAVLRKPDQQA
jgi:SAM-dependent methyltransferase